MAISTAALLKRHRPLLKYDSQEAFFADSAAELTDNPGNVLRQTDGTIVATAADGSRSPPLGAQGRCRRRRAATDVLSDPSGDYRRQARALHAQAVYANQIYGHAARDSAGELWLQYWFFYFYKRLQPHRKHHQGGLHEGDWEMIQIHLDGDAPDRAVLRAAQGGRGGATGARSNVVPRDAAADRLRGTRLACELLRSGHALDGRLVRPRRRQAQESRSGAPRRRRHEARVDLGALAGLLG